MGFESMPSPESLEPNKPEKGPQEEGLSNGAKKVEEYISRIRNGESKESILKGLPPSFVAGIEAGLNGSPNEDAPETSVEQNVELENDRSLEDFIDNISRGRKQAVKDLYDNLFDNRENPQFRKKLATGLFHDVYNKYRIADYPVDPNEEVVWENALDDAHIPIDNRNNDWSYRGIFPQKGQETVARGSFNVKITPELIKALDDMILSGKIQANYKFGQPGTKASPTERHDSISIYFLEEPSKESLEELTNIIKPYVRGDNLLGEKIGDGFFLSEIGSIATPHIESFVEGLKTKDPAFAEAVRGYTTPSPGRGTSLKMSEAQFYAIKDVAKAFGYNIGYDKSIGFSIEK